MSNYIVNGDCLDHLRSIDSVRCLWADPPDNLGLDYQGYKDSKPLNSYLDWLDLLMALALAKSEIFWLSYYYKYDLEISRRLAFWLRNNYPSRQVRKFVWTYTFGQYNDTDFTNGYRPILRISKPNISFNFTKLRVPSQRMLNNDNRASGPRVPDDVWNFPRVTKGHPEYCDWHPTQHPQGVLGRIALSSIDDIQNQRVVDLFGGTGSMLKVCLANQINCTYVDQSLDYCKRVSRETGVPVNNLIFQLRGNNETR